MQQLIFNPSCDYFKN